MSNSQKTTLASLGNVYRQKIDEAQAKFKAAAKEVLELTGKFKDTLRNAKKGIGSIGEHAQVDEAIMMSFLANLAGDIQGALAFLELQKAQAIKDRELNTVNVYQARIDSIKKHKESLTNYNNYTKLHLQKSQIEKQLQREDLPQDRKEALNKKLVEVVDNLDTIAAFFGHKSDNETFGKEVDGAERKMLGLEDGAKNYLDNVRNGTEALVTSLSEKVAFGDTTAIEEIMEKTYAMCNKEVSSLINSANTEIAAKTETKSATQEQN